MNDYLKLDQAAAYVVRINNDPEFTADRILQDCADGRIPIYWRNSAQITTRLFDFTKTIPGTDSFGKWLELHPYDVAQFETAEQADILSFELTDQDMATLEKLNISAVDDAGNVAVYRHPAGGKCATVRRDQLHVDIQRLKLAYAAPEVPVKETAVVLPPPDAPAGNTAPAPGGEVAAPGSTTASEPAQGIAPPPVALKTREIAGCFNGFHEWDFNKWISNLQTPAPWLEACRDKRGNQGKPTVESTWWPVKIAEALDKKHKNVRRQLHARFKKQEPLKPWLESLETNLPDDSDT